MKFKITEQTDSRLDHFLVASTELNRSQITALIKDGLVMVNGLTTKAGYKLKNGD